MRVPPFNIEKLSWPINLALTGATFSIFALIYNPNYLNYGLLTFATGILSQVIGQWFNFLNINDERIKLRGKFIVIFTQFFFIALWINLCLSIFPPTNKIPQDWLLPGLSVIAAIASAIAAWRTYNISKNNYTFEVHRMFLDTMLQFDYSKINDQDYLNIYWYGRVCDFFEFICYEREKGKLNEEAMDIFKVVMAQPQYVNYAKARNEKSEKSFESYIRWISKEKI